MKIPTSERELELSQANGGAMLIIQRLLEPIFSLYQAAFASILLRHETVVSTAMSSLHDTSLEVELMDDDDANTTAPKATPVRCHVLNAMYRG
jgi:hypothetical protein